MNPRILHIGPIPPEAGGSAAGGIATHVWDLAVQFRKHGYETYVFAGAGATSGRREGVNIIGAPRGSRLGKLSRSVRFRFSLGHSLPGRPRIGEKFRLLYLGFLLRQALDEIKPDLIHLHSLADPAGLSLVCQDLPAPLLVTNYELWIREDRVRKMSRVNRVASRASGLLHISEYTAERAHSLGLRYEGKERVVYMPVRPERIPLLDKAAARNSLGWDEKPIIFFYGTHYPLQKKGLDLLLRAFSGSPELNRNYRLIIRTAGEGEAYARSVLRQGGLDGTVLGRIPWEQMVCCYNAADLFVMPSRSEGFGIAYVEALLAGTPVVGFHRTLGELERLIGIRIGEKFDPEREDPSALALKMLHTLATPFTREKLREGVVAGLSWENRFREFETVYSEVIANGPNRRPSGSGKKSGLYRCPT